MDAQQKERLKYRNQYILSDGRINCPFLHNVLKINPQYFLYTHIDLLVNEIHKNGVRLILLGDMLDYENPKKGNSDILADLAESDYNVFLDKTSRFAGRFVLIHVSEHSVKLMHDATACRKIYYYQEERTVCASQPHLLARVLDINMTTDKEKLAFYRSPVFNLLNNSNIGDLTCYDTIFQLLPNHYLTLDKFEITRYWSNTIQKDLTFKETVDICAKMLQGYVESIGQRYNIMLPVTAGKDSRTLLAATWAMKNEVYYYINKENRLDNKSLDIVIPQKLIKDLGLDFHILDPYHSIDEDFIEVYYENNPLASAFYLPHIYNYFINFPDKVNLPGNFVASAFDMYGNYVKNVTPKVLSVFNWVSKYDFAVNYYQKWLEGNQEFCKKNCINTLMLFYWEERLANWGTQIQIDKDIAQEDLIPFNSRQLIHYFFSIKPEHIDRPDFHFFKEIIRKLWSELLLTPTNPSLKNRITRFIYKMGLLEAVRVFLYLYQIKLRSVFVRTPKKKKKFPCPPPLTP
jgi:hypothetical protein